MATDDDTQEKNSVQVMVDEGDTNQQRNYEVNYLVINPNVVIVVFVLALVVYAVVYAVSKMWNNIGKPWTLEEGLDNTSIQPYLQ